MRTDLQQLNEAYHTKVFKEEELAVQIDPAVAFGRDEDDEGNEASAMASFEAELDELISRANEAANEFGSFKAPGVKMRMSRFAREKIYKALR